MTGHLELLLSVAVFGVACVFLGYVLGRNDNWVNR